MRRLLGLVVAAVVVAMTLFAALTVTPALGNHVQCGDTITQNTKLDSDLIDCPGDGIVIGADNITLDLNGHPIDGDESGSYKQGIHNGAGEDAVTVKGPGVIQGFAYGVALTNASDNVVRGIVASHNGFGIRLEGHTAINNLIVQNFVSDNEYGVYMTDEYALNVEAGNNQVQGNSLSANLYGIVLSGEGNGNVISHNKLYQNGNGILLSDSFGRTLVSKNDVSRNDTGIDSIELQNSRIEKNQVVDNRGIGIGIDEFDDRNNVIEGNVASRNARDGIVVFRDNTVRRNTANENGDLGIDAQPGVIDGGGNRAFGNGNPLQCLNVACK
jgi:parallel beta-helix repeat protein